MNKLKIIYSDNYLKYDLGADNPISKNKTQSFFKKIESEKNFNIEIIEPKDASDKDLSLVHTPEYLKELKSLALNNINADPDTPVNQGMLTGGKSITGGTILCLKNALKGDRVVNLIGGMHHASSSSASGFCIYNDHAIAIRKLQSEGNIKKAAVIDLDVHAGQGTQKIFYSDPNVLTISIHQDPFTIFPGIGFDSQKGEGQGLGTNINIPLPPETSEKKYLEALESAINSAKTFNPDIFVLILGVDTYKDDFLGNFNLGENSYFKIGEKFRKIKRLAILFGGGYSNKIPDLWINFLKGYLKY